MWPTLKARKLCQALLTKRGHVVPKDQLFEWLWPHLTPASAGNSLRVSISQLRRLLEPEIVRGSDSTYVLTRGDGYLFRTPSNCWIDVDAFLKAKARGQNAERVFDWSSAIESYRTAVALYRGDYLEDESYAEWALGEREFLRENRLTVLERLAECFARQKDYVQALETSQELLAIAPLRESAYRQIMLYHYRLGQRDQALRAFEQCERLLAEELDVSPEPATRQLMEDILHGKVCEQVSLVPLPSELRTNSVGAHDLLPFLARRREMATLAGLLREVMARQGRVALIVGDAGVGKTRLVEEFLFSILGDASIFRGQAFELEQDITFQPIREAVEH